MKWLTVLLLVLVLASTVMPAAALNPEKSQQRKAAHQITFVIHKKGDNGEDITGRALCTANALGAHALLTANHCDAGETEITVDRELVPRAIFGRITDGEDHVIFLVGGPVFKDTMKAYYSPDSYKENKVGDETFLYGDGGGMFPPQYRQGRRMGTVVMSPEELKYLLISDPNLYMFDINIIGGDSGSAIYDLKTGKLVTLVTYGVADKFCGAYKMDFTQEQISRAETF
jgi:hypothetical protein